MRRDEAVETAALVVAAGRGARLPGEVPKQYRSLAGEPVLARALRPLLAHPAIAHVLVVIHPDDAERYAGTAPHHDKLAQPVLGGATRQDSVRLGLASLQARAPARVLIHDAARPFLTAAVIDRVLEGLDSAAAVLPAVPVADTLKRADAAGIVIGTVARDGLFAAQTPQGFAYSLIMSAHEQAIGNPTFTDDTAVAEAAGLSVTLVAGDPANIKLTTAEDFAIAERRLAAALPDIRVGNGYDVHALGPGDGVVLGGVRIAHDRALIGHSDADVALHALTDAVLGAIGEADIGTHFPPSDPAWRGAASDRFLAHAVGLARNRGARLMNLDLTIVAEAPRIGPHREAMRARIAAIAGLPPNRVAVKATTNEGLGFLGRGEGIAAFATATVAFPPETP